ncbi:MAG: hypothetical protein QMC80_06315 [Thermoplasmatales archaeon]|nr:hypothetical protein [Thermoplasmatales archaeon]
MEQKHIKKPFWPWLIPIIATVYTAWVVLLALDKTFGFAKAYEYFGFDTWLYIGSAIFIAFIVIMILFTPAGRKIEYEEEKKEKKPVTVEAVETEMPAEALEPPPLESALAEGAGIEAMETEAHPRVEAVEQIPAESGVAAAEETGILPQVEVLEEAIPPEPELEQDVIPENYNIIPYPKEVSGAIYADTFIPLNETEILNMRTFIGRSCLLCDKQEECWENYKNTMTHDEFLSNTECLRVKKHGENAC